MIKKAIVIILGLVLVAGLVLSAFVSPGIVSADPGLSETLRPNAAGSSTQLNKEGGATNWGCVLGNDSYYVQGSGPTKIDLYNIDNPTFPDNSEINSVTVWARCRRSDSTDYNGYFGISSSGTASWSAETTFGSSYVYYDKTYTIDPHTSVAWTKAAITALQLGLKIDGAYGGIICNYAYIVVDYTTSPTVISSAATNVEETTATWNGEITSTGGPAVDYRGFVWGTTSKADPGNVAPASSGYDSQWYQSGTYGTGTYSYNVPSLVAGETYYYRACAYNSIGWDYSNTQQTVYTKPESPTSLNATVISSNQINLSWAKGTGSEKTMVRRKRDSYPTGTADGDQAYFDTGTSVPDTGVSGGHSYFYRAWAWDTNGGYSDGYSEAFGTTPLGGLYLKLWYEPTAIISGSSLPDRSGGGHHGTITWGSNPGGIEVSIGGLEPFSAYVAPGVEDDEIPQVLPIPGTISPDATAGVTGEGLPMQAGFQRAADSLEWTLPVTYSVMFIIVALVVGVAGFAIGSTWGFTIGFGSTAAFFGAIRDSSGYLVMPIWITIIVVMLALFIGFVWRTT